MGLASIPRGVGHNFTPEYQISAVPYLIDANGGVNIKVDANGGIDPAGSNIHKIELPKISQWLQFQNQTGGDVKVFFSRKEAVTDGKHILVKNGVTTFPLHLRCTNLYFAAGGHANFHIVAGLTAIDRLEFTEVVETFLGDAT